MLFQHSILIIRLVVSIRHLTLVSGRSPKKIVAPWSTGFSGDTVSADCVILPSLRLLANQAFSLVVMRVSFEKFPVQFEVELMVFPYRLILEG